MGKLEEIESLDNTKSKQPLTGRQKFLFGMLCWGVQSWGQVERFKTNGYDRKYHEAKKAMYIGMLIYGVGILLFILILVLNMNG